MRSRLLDVALIAGLVVVAGGIMWTLFNLGSGTSPPPSSPTPSTTATPASPSSPTITPVAPGSTAPGTTVPGTNGGSAPAAGTDPVDPAAGAATPADPPPAASSTAAAGSTAAPDRVVPPGTLALERVGFSYVTGGAGACGVVLEAWRHVAVSRDLLATYGCGAEVTVTLDDPAGGRSEVVGVIGDTMNPSFALTVNVYVAEDEDAFAYGLTTGTFAPR